MRIIIASEIFPPDSGGPATFVVNLIPHLKKAGHEVSLITYGDLTAKIKDYDFKIFRIPRNNLIVKFFLYTKKLLTLAKDADVIFCQGPIASGLPVLIVKWLTGKKVIMKIVGDVVWERARNKYGLKETIDEFQGKKYCWKINLSNKLKSFIVKRVDQIITPSRYLKKIVSGWGADPDKIKVIYNSFDARLLNLTKEECKKQINVSGKIIMSIGRLASWKGFDTLIELMPEFLKINPDFKLMIVGEGPEENNLKSLIKKLALDDTVITTGNIDHQEIGKYYQAADYWVLNTGYEGLSHSLLEALAYRLPVAVSKIGGNPEVIEDKVNGRLFEYNNRGQIVEALQFLENNPAVVQEYVNNGQKTLADFSFNKMVENYLRLF